MKLFYVLKGEETMGPYSIEDLTLMLRSGTIGQDTLYATDGASEWRPVTALVRHREESDKYTSQSWAAVFCASIVVIIAVIVGFIQADHGEYIMPLICGVPIYFIPALVARGNMHKNTAAICALNILLG